MAFALSDAAEAAMSAITVASGSEKPTASAALFAAARTPKYVPVVVPSNRLPSRFLSPTNAATTLEARPPVNPAVDSLTIMANSSSV